jgi:hypothetical protein
LAQSQFWLGCRPLLSYLIGVIGVRRVWLSNQTDKNRRSKYHNCRIYDFPAEVKNINNNEK